MRASEANPHPTTWTVDGYTAQFDDAMLPRLVPEPGDELVTVPYPDAREWDAFIRRLHDGDCTIGNFVDTDDQNRDHFEIVRRES